MTQKEILSHVDHTLLKPYATWDDIQNLCREAVKHKTAAVCIAPNYIKRVRAKFKKKLKICTVVGFPLGFSSKEAKLVEVIQALEDGADEIDMVINISDVKNGDFDKVSQEISLLKNAVDDKILKVIIETCYLNEDEKIKLCEIIKKLGAHYIKTSTGFGTAGAVMEDILLFKKHIGKDVKIKAAGGIKTREDMEAFLKAGCDRIGTSWAVKNLKME
ncbi:deoxyribose-phosphate aldolase [Johnsonella ignava ATCC 51276]|uniref:Deoxyribose-phosphate aldolase n=1 Tax=Johnsonella ignava ATCC 51276 TaxID=679200 RepID=G5GGJ3_9FIRM|nr:deoxyribose-phosphate aldolase [Johnsonella ignava]EHI56153.1 deoxyribose-phosphate aldolase [Johnsonella ignava ATCC 51276]